jgi:hypothetical protein
MSQVIMVLLATGAATAASMAELGKNGNLHTHWNPICNKFGSFCTRVGVSLVSSFVGVVLMLALNLISAAAMRQMSSPQSPQTDPAQKYTLNVMSCEMAVSQSGACGSQAEMS